MTDESSDPATATTWAALVEVATEMHDPILAECLTLEADGEREAALIQSLHKAVRIASCLATEIAAIDAVISDRPAMDKPTRAANIAKALQFAQRTDLAELRLLNISRLVRHPPGRHGDFCVCAPCGVLRKVIDQLPERLRPATL